MSPEAAPLTPIRLDDSALYANRELSWLDFNQRVLAEAYDARVPLLERVRFLAIAAANLDEFVGTRVAWLERVSRSDPGPRTPDGRTAAEQLSLVRTRVQSARRE